jgi:RimJ/RimL family protein N-acetyltransferase
MRNYKCLRVNLFSEGNYCIVPIRYEDRYDILNWRNTQIDILRQQAPLTREQQDNYFKVTIAPLFEKEQPNQILWSFLENDKLIGYGGLVHIDWDAKHAEISFLLNNEHNSDILIFKRDWDTYLKLITKVAFNELKFQKIHTYAYDIRDYYFEVMYAQGFEKEAQLKNHILIKGQLTDILILSKFNFQK